MNIHLVKRFLPLILPVSFNAGRWKKAPVMAACLLAFVVASPAAHAHEWPSFLSYYEMLLARHTQPTSKDGVPYTGVHYDGWGRDAHHKLAKTALLATNPEDFTRRHEKLAYWINAYNFLVIDLIVTKGERESIRNLGDLLETPWTAYSWQLGDERYTLHEIKNRILMPMGEPRVHFALSCATVSCPDLMRTAYRGSTLDTQLDEQVRASLTNEAKMYRYVPSANEAYISPLFVKYADDFNNRDIKSWINEFRPNELKPSTDIHIFPYDWSLNKL